MENHQYLQAAIGVAALVLVLTVGFVFAYMANKKSNRNAHHPANGHHQVQAYGTAHKGQPR